MRSTWKPRPRRAGRRGARRGLGLRVGAGGARGHRARRSRRAARRSPRPVAAEVTNTSRAGERRASRSAAASASLLGTRSAFERQGSAAARPGRRRARAARASTVAWFSTGSQPSSGARSSTCTSSRQRSTWARNSWPRPGARAGALDQPRDVGQHQLALVGLDRAEHRLERGERVVGDLRRARGEPRQQRALARVGQAHQAGVGEQLEPQLQPALLAGQAALGEARRLPGRVGEALVAAPPGPPRATTARWPGAARSQRDRPPRPRPPCPAAPAPPAWPRGAVALGALAVAAALGLEVRAAAETRRGRAASRRRPAPRRRRGRRRRRRARPWARAPRGGTTPRRRRRRRPAPRSSPGR